MNTLFMLMARHNSLPLIPIETVCRDYFSHLTPTKFIEKVRAGEIKLPLVRLEKSQKAAKGVSLNDLAAYLDGQIAAAQRDLKELTRA